MIIKYNDRNHSSAGFCEFFIGFYDAGGELGNKKLTRGERKVKNKNKKG